MKIYITILLLTFSVSLGISVFTIPNLDSHGRWYGRSTADIRSLSSIIEKYKNDFDQIPSQDIAFERLVKNEKNIKYLKKLPRDYWGSQYIYKVNNNQFQIYSAGPDKVDDNGMRDDVILGKKNYDCEIYHDCLSIKDYISIIFVYIALASMILFILSLLYVFSIFIRKNKEL